MSEYNGNIQRRMEDELREQTRLLTQLTSRLEYIEKTLDAIHVLVANSVAMSGSSSEEGSDGRFKY